MNCLNPPRSLCNNNNCAKCYNNSFASHEKSRYISNKNLLDLRSLTRSSAKKILFDCECGHAFISQPSYINKGTWCPYCANRSLCINDDCKLCYEKSFASSDKAKYWSDINNCKPRNVFKSASQKYTFNCICNHSFESRLHSITAGFWCPYCANIKLCDNNNCDTCYKKSFASHDKSKYWSNENNILPRNIFNGTIVKYKFNCNECNHSFDSSISEITGAKHTWCPYCGLQILCDNINCNFCYEKSFASHEKSKYWSSNNIKTPKEIFKKSSYKGLFDCKCGHTFESTISNITANKNWCPYCSKFPTKLCNKDTCIQCFNNSFASIDASKYWSKSNELKPRQVFKNTSRTKYKFNCLYCNKIYESCPHNVTIGIWCNCTINKTESKLHNYLLSICNFAIEKQKKFDWCKKKLCLPFDFCIEQYKLIIELDGPQHFMQISNWKDPIKTRLNDKFKMTCANEHGYSVIRILQTDVLNNKNDWESKLKTSIKRYGTATNIFLGNSYDEWKNDIT